MSPQVAVNVLWAVWYVTWIGAVVLSRRTKVQMKTDMVGWHRVLVAFGALLLFVPPGTWRRLDSLHAGLGKALLTPLWWAQAPVQWALVAATVAGFAFCWWARAHLGRLWSGFVTLKEGHRIVDTGPYGLVRHPIYSGVIFSALMTALLRATPAALVGAVLIALGFWTTARIEERFLRAQLGTEAYDAYSRRVRMLVPGLF
jgi:protein-S-isoprenylcysteine O-methyltransferase Ste14